MQEELTLKELILAIQDYSRYFFRKWYWIVTGGIVFGAIFFSYSYTVPVNFVAPLSFMLNEEDDVGLGAGAILGQLGLGGSVEGNSSGFKILELVKSRQIVGPILFDSVSIDSSKRLVADHLIELYNYHEKWRKNEEMRQFYFHSPNSNGKDIVRNRAFKELHMLIVGGSSDNSLLSVGVDENSGIFNFSVTSRNSELSVYLVNKIYQRVVDFYTGSIISSKKKTLQQLVIRADSVAQALAMTELNLARLEDRNSGFLRREDDLKLQSLQRETLILTSMYGEIIKNRETASFLLANEKPVFQIIDSPLFPLSVKGADSTRVLFIGSLLGAFVAGIFLFFIKLIKDTMS